MTSATYLNGSWHCYELVGKRQRLIGCSHRSPKSAIAHTSGTYVPPLRASDEATTPVPAPPSGAGSLVASPEPPSATLGL